MSDDSKTIHMGDVEAWMDDRTIGGYFMTTIGYNAMPTVRINRDHLGRAGNFAFIEFSSHEFAVKALSTLNGTPIPGTNKVFKLNWAHPLHGGSGADFPVYVGDLGTDISEYQLLTFFQQRYGSVKSVKILTGPDGLSRGFGFVRFTNAQDQTRSLTEMNGAFLNQTRIRVQPATQRTSTTNAASASIPSPFGMPHPPSQVAPASVSPVATNAAGQVISTVFVGNLDPYTTDMDVRSRFAIFGEIVFVKILSQRGVGFVQFSFPQQAYIAIQQMHGALIRGRNIRCDWGKQDLRSTTSSSSIGERSVGGGGSAMTATWTNASESNAAASRGGVDNSILSLEAATDSVELSNARWLDSVSHSLPSGIRVVCQATQIAGLLYDM